MARKASCDFTALENDDSISSRKDAKSLEPIRYKRKHSGNLVNYRGTAAKKPCHSGKTSSGNPPAILGFASMKFARGNPAIAWDVLDSNQ